MNEFINARVHYFDAGDYVDDDQYHLYLVGDTVTDDIEPYLYDGFTVNKACIAFAFNGIYVGCSDERGDYAGMIEYNMRECDMLSTFEDDIPVIKRLFDTQRREGGVAVDLILVYNAQSYHRPATWVGPEEWDASWTLTHYLDPVSLAFIPIDN